MRSAAIDTIAEFDLPTEAEMQVMIEELPDEYDGYRLQRLAKGLGRSNAKGTIPALIALMLHSDLARFDAKRSIAIIAKRSADSRQEIINAMQTTSDVDVRLTLLDIVSDLEHRRSEPYR